MPMLDIFRDSAFDVVPLTDAINNLKFVPGRIGQLGLFSESGITTTSAAIEQKDGQLTLIAPTPRGGPGHTVEKVGRNLRAVIVPHFEINDAVQADEVQNVRAWGSETEVETVQGKITEQQGVHTQSMEATHEYSRIGAVKGLITYADGSTLDLFDTFEVDQIAEIDFDLDNAAPASGALRTKCTAVSRLIANELGAIPFSGIWALVGDTFFDQLVAHPEVRATYLQTQAAADLRQPIASGNGTAFIYGSFTFGGITFENYRGAVGTTAFIAATKAHFFPTGVPSLFRTYYAPADYIETVNTVGRRLYNKQYEMANGKGVHFDTQMNGLDICTRPRVLIQGRNT